MNPRKLFSYNLYMITGMMLFYLGGLVLYLTENQIYGTILLGVGLVMFVLSVEKIIYGMAMLKHPEKFKDLAIIQREKEMAGHLCGKIERKQKYAWILFFVLLLIVAVLKLTLAWAFGPCVIFLLFYLWTSHQLYQLRKITSTKVTK